MTSSAQTSFAFPRAHGGRRDGAGRKPTRPGTWVPHAARPWLDGRQPVHITMRVRRGVPNLRSYRLAATVGKALTVHSASESPRHSARRETFRVVQFSIQPNHLHLIVEATSKIALARGMQGLASSLARRVNRTLRRRGSLFSDRYHAHALATPTEVRNALVYVLKNYEKHPEPIPDLGTEPQQGIDPCSSALWFTGWAEPIRPPPQQDPPVAEARTWLMRVGWQRTRSGRGLVDRRERPAGVLGISA